MTMYLIMILNILLSCYNTYEVIKIHKKIQTQREVDKLTQLLLAEHNQRLTKLEMEVK